jgi:hypothetical protein
VRNDYGLVTETILLTVPAGPRGAGVMALVLGGLGSRLDLPIDRVDELTLAAEAVGASALGESLELEMTILTDRLLLRIGPLEGGAMADVARRRVVEPLVDGVADIQRAGRDWFELELKRGLLERQVAG